MTVETDEYQRLGYFSETVAADTRRKEFDIRNHSLLHSHQRPDFLFIGDSITHYWELGAYFQKPGQLIINRGIGGDTSTYLRKRFYVDALQLCPRYCILGIGVNDSIELEGDYWKLIPPTPYETLLANSMENIKAVVAQAKDSSITLILASLLPIHMPISLHEAERKQFVCDINGFLFNLAVKEHLIFLDYYSAIVDPKIKCPLDGTTYDGIHPNAVGYEIMADVLRTTLGSHEIEI